MPAKVEITAFEQKRRDDAEEKIQAMLEHLPGAVSSFVDYMSTHATALTRLGYVYDLRLFFRYLHEKQPKYKEIEIEEITPEMLEKLTQDDFDGYKNYLKKGHTMIDSEGNIIKKGTKSAKVKNENIGVTRKISAVRSFYKYLYTRGKIKTNNAKEIELPKLTKKNIIFMEKREVNDLINTVETGNGLSKRQKSYVENYKTRDMAILTLMLGTGIRESELVGLDITSVDLSTGKFKIVRKGGKEASLQIPERAILHLENYLAEREEIEAVEGNEDALFLSSQKKRLSVRALQDIVKKYTKVAVPDKKISAHKLRSTYATLAFRKTNDILMIGDQLGHENIQTTLRYTAANERNSEKAANNVDWI